MAATGPPPSAPWSPAVFQSLHHLHPRVLTDHPRGAKLFGKAEPDFIPPFLKATGQKHMDRSGKRKDCHRMHPVPAPRILTVTALTLHTRITRPEAQAVVRIKLNHSGGLPTISVTAHALTERPT